MKLEPITKLCNRNRTPSKNFKMTAYRQTLMSLSFSGFMTILNQSGSRTLGAWYVILAFSVLLGAKVLFLPKSKDFLKKNADISEMKQVLALKGIFSETSYACVLTYQYSSF